MKLNNIRLLTAVSLLSMLVLGGCGHKSEDWAYAHDPSTEVLELSDNGKAEYKGDSYSYTRDDNFIKLTGKSGENISLRYEMEQDNMILYEKSTYSLSGDKAAEGIVGLWTQDNGWSFQFTEDGRFSEEDIFFGRYSVDEGNSCIRLMYDDPIEDAFLYYSLDGDKLIVDYPWPMVRVEG